MLLFILYAAILIGVGFATRNKVNSGVNSADAFFVNSRSSGSFAVSLSIVAACVGASATIGVTGLAWKIGTPAFWWLGVGAIGLSILTMFLSKKIRETGARTMPEMIVTFIGAPARPLSSSIIAVAWLSILAAQYSAMTTIISALTGLEPSYTIIIGAALIISYSMLGGQAAVITSNIFQFFLMMLGLIITFVWLLSNNSGVSFPFEVLNSEFTVSKLTYYMLILGSSYVVCPMLFGKILSAKDPKAAFKGAWYAVLGLILCEIIIVGIGIYCRGLVPADTVADKVLTTMLVTHFSPWLSSLVFLGLVGAILSSADSCLLTAATVCSNDLLRRGDIKTCRIVMLVFGVIALILSKSNKSILELLLMANDIYVCGVVAPVFIGMVFYKKFKADAKIMMLAMFSGGALGLTSAMLGMFDNGYFGVISEFSVNNGFIYAGLAASTIISLAALKPIKKQKVI